MIEAVVAVGLAVAGGIGAGFRELLSVRDRLARIETELAGVREDVQAIAKGLERPAR